MSEYYFAFGSNMDKERMIKRSVEFIETEMQKGILNDWKLVFNKIRDDKEGAGYANIEPEIGSIVEGIIYKTNQDGIKKLDRREGVPDHYIQKIIPVKNNDKKLIDCVIYIANQSKTNDSLKPEKWYLNHLLAGKEFLSKDYFKNLKNTETLD